MRKALFLGSHCDDIELGCGATIHKHKHDWDIVCYTFTKTGVEGFPAYGVGSLWEVSRRSLGSLGVDDIRFGEFPICRYDLHCQDIWLTMRRLNEEIKPDLVFTHYNDESRDHQVIFKESIRNFEKSDIYTYVPSITTGPHFEHRAYEMVYPDDIAAKMKALSYYDIYSKKSYFQPDIVMSQARMYGVLCQSPYAEAFGIVRKLGV